MSTGSGSGIAPPCPVLPPIESTSSLDGDGGGGAAEAMVTLTLTDADDDVFLEASAEGLDHIADREDHQHHEQMVKDSIIPTSAPPSPMGRRRSSIVSPQRRMSHVPGENGGNGLRRSNSTSTLFVDSTVSRPNMEDTLRCVALALRYTIEDGHKQEDPELFPAQFDEKTFPLTEAAVPLSYSTRVPTDGEIYEFMNRLFHAAALTAECGIITIVYINRVIMYTGLALHSSNWKRVLLGAILMASKVWDDQAVWNVDFCSILPKIEVDDMNDLERTYLEMLQFNINVDSSVYAKYYFELRSLAEEAERPFPLEPMSIAQAAKLEATAKHVAEAATRDDSIRGSKSLGHQDFPTRAVLP